MIDYETLLQRALDCETLADAAIDKSVREKCIELAKEFRKLAKKAKRLREDA